MLDRTLDTLMISSSSGHFLYPSRGTQSNLPPDSVTGLEDRSFSLESRSSQRNSLRCLVVGPGYIRPMCLLSEQEHLLKQQDQGVRFLVHHRKRADRVTVPPTSPTSPTSPRVRFSYDEAPPTSPIQGSMKKASSIRSSGARVIRTFEEIDRIVPKEEWYEELECGM